MHQNAYLYSLPFPYHELKHFRHFEDVQSNNGEILKADYRLWSKVRSLELVHSDQIDFKNLFSLIKMNMPKLSSITFRGNNAYKLFNPNDSDGSYNEIERINVRLDSVTTVDLEGMSIKQIQQTLIHSLPNLQCLRLKYTELPSKENELTSFLGQKLQQIEFDQDSLHGKNHAEEKDFSYLCNLKYLKVS